MKAHVSTVSAKTRTEIKRLADEYAKKYIAEQKEGFMRRVLKAVYYTMNREFGFGKKRIQILDEALWTLMNEALEDEAFFEHIDRVVIDELGVDLKRETINKDGYPVD